MRCKKNKKLLRLISNFLLSENFIILTIVFGVFVALLKYYSVELKRNDKTILISVTVASIAYATFFIDYQKNYITDTIEKVKIKKLIEGLFASSFFPIISLLFFDDLDFGPWNKFIVYPAVSLVILSIFIFSFCFIKLWLLVVKKIFKKK